MIEELRGLGFRKAMMAEDAVNSRARAIVKVAVALGKLMMSVYIGFERLGGGWSCQLLNSRSGLADPNSTIPKNELQSLCSGSNLGWTVEKDLEDWVFFKIFCSDSTIALCWTTAEMKPLSMFQQGHPDQEGHPGRAAGPWLYRVKCCGCGYSP